MQLTLRSVQIEDIQKSGQQTGGLVRLRFSDQMDRDASIEWLEVQVAVARDIERLPTGALVGNILMQLHDAIGQEIELRRNSV